MNDEVLLSVCVITYNQEKFIRQTLDSILLQEHSFSYEILIGDDCSQDKTRNIISEYAEKYPEIIVPIFNQKNLGIVGNYFNVLGHASGKYVMECAGDDWWLPGKVTQQIEFLEQNPEIGMCYGKAKEFLNSKNRFTKKYIGKKCEEFSQLLERNEIPALTVCFRRELANKYLDSWPMDRLNKVDQAILALGIYELKYTETPPVVAINEAVELSKKYSDEKVTKMINAVLDEVYHEGE